MTQLCEGARKGRSRRRTNGTRPPFKAALLKGLLIGSLLSGCVRNEAPTGTLRWRQEEVVVLVVGAADGWPTDTELSKSLERSVKIWRNACGGCAFPSLRFVRDMTRHAVRADGVNVIRVETGRWCAESQESSVAPCGPNEVIARTEIYERDVSQTPGIREADVRLNGHDPRFGENGNARALDAVVLHEMGHFLGLVHTDGADDVMNPVPLAPERSLRLKPTAAEGARLRRLYSQP